MNDDPRLTDVTAEMKKLQKSYDDIIWENGLNDTRLIDLASRLTELKQKLKKGELYDPNF
tara:strand:+ start:129 stop:308 length:180 start_codon:yes stop_codon:yes gene_type:complete